jgi:IS5 family transposase
MRQERTVQASIFDLFASHEIGRELKAISQWLDDNREVVGLVAGALRRIGLKATGRQGLPAEAVLRCALLKQHRQLSYQGLAFHLEDSASFRAFARLPWSCCPKRARKIQYTRGRPNRVQRYRELIAITCSTLGHLEQASEGVDGLPPVSLISCLEDGKKFKYDLDVPDYFAWL